MTSTPLPIILDVAVLAIGLIALLIEAFEENKNKSIISWLCIGGIGVVFALSFFLKPITFSETSQLAQFYSADSFAIFYKRLALGSTLLVLIMAREFRGILSRYLPAAVPGAGVGEFFALPVLTCLGLMWMASAIDFVMAFVSIELVTISFYILVSYMRRSASSLEAGVKYLILGALSTGFLVYGITWIYGATGQTNFARIGEAIRLSTDSMHPAILFGMALILVGLGFKIAAAPFQLWVADVYQGAPTPITAFLSVGSKAAGFILLMRVLHSLVILPAVPAISDKLMAALWGMAILTLIYGNLAAMPQGNLKRLLAFSSVAHAGYLLVSLASWKTGTSEVTVSYYLAGYLLMTMLSFLILVVINRATGGDDIASFNGLSRRSPFLAFGMLVSMISLAGVPFTVGFFGKFLVFRDAIAEQQWALVAVAILSVGAGFYYYLKVVRAMYWKAPSENGAITISPLTRATICILSALIFILGTFPAPVLGMLK